MESSDNRAELNPVALGGYYSFGDIVYMGISRTQYPDWIGWPVVDMYIPIHPGAFICNRYLDQMVQEFYIDHPPVVEESDS